MFDHSHYVPILRWKAAERNALRELRPAISKRITPLIEPTPWSFEDKKPKEPEKQKKQKTIEQKISKIAEDMFQLWGQDPIFIDFWQVPPRVRLVDGKHALVAMGEEARSRQLQMIPVTGLDRDVEYQDVVSSIIKVDGLGLCIRILRDDLQSPLLNVRLQGLLSRFGLLPEQVDLILDIQYIECPYESVEDLVVKLPDLDRWRTFTVALGSFPEDLSGFKIGKALHPRFDWLTWRDCLIGGTMSIRKPSFGDYTIQHPNFSEPPEFASFSASIRYTADENWVIMRGESVRKDDGPGYDQWPANAQILCEQSEFKGKAFSRGDEYIASMAEQIEHPGNASTWLQAGFNHHMTFVVHQIANLCGISIAGESVHATIPSQRLSQDRHR